MMETPEKAAPMTPVTGGRPVTEVGTDAFQPPFENVDEVGEEHGWKEGRCDRLVFDWTRGKLHCPSLLSRLTKGTVCKLAMYIVPIAT